MGIFLRIAFLSAFSLAVLSSVCSAEEYEYREYMVKKGDTLWDISQMALEDNFQWPLIWKENLRINNPDLIYPGQVIMIPVRVLDQKQGRLSPAARPPMEAPKPGPKPEKEKPVIMKPAAKKPPKVTVIKPTRVDPILPRQTILEIGYIARKVPYRGEITHSYLGRKIFGPKDELYVKTSDPAEVGDRFYVIRNEAEVRHPNTGENLGYLIRVLGTLEVQESGTSGLKARVIESFDRIDVGDALDDYYEIETPFSAGEPRKPDVQGVVIASKYMRNISGSFDLVFIDRGSAHDLRMGDVVMTLARGTDDRINALMQLVNIRETTSMAVILHSETEVVHGDLVTKVQ
jgi:LysM repeat protein